MEPRPQLLKLKELNPEQQEEIKEIITTLKKLLAWPALSETEIKEPDYQTGEYKEKQKNKYRKGAWFNPILNGCDFLLDFLENNVLLKERLSALYKKIRPNDYRPTAEDIAEAEDITRQILSFFPDDQEIRTT